MPFDPYEYLAAGALKHRLSPPRLLTVLHGVFFEISPEQAKALRARVAALDPALSPEQTAAALRKPVDARPSDAKPPETKP